MGSKNKIFLHVLICISLFSFKAVSQKWSPDSYLYITQLQLNQNPNLLLQNQNPELSKNIQSSDNFVNLNQVGNNNNVELKQIGYEAQLVSQLGDNNYYGFINYYNKTPLNLNLLQKGNSNSLHIYGVNSIIKNISIIQKTNFKSLIIKNY